MLAKRVLLARSLTCRTLSIAVITMGKPKLFQFSNRSRTSEKTMLWLCVLLACVTPALGFRVCSVPGFQGHDWIAFDKVEAHPGFIPMGAESRVQLAKVCLEMGQSIRNAG
jgi:hypothetical protein